MPLRSPFALPKSHARRGGASGLRADRHHSRDRKRLQLFFDYDHRFAAYVPMEKRRFGYFALPVLVGDEIVAVVDLKTDRERQKLLVQKWTRVSNRSRQVRKRQIEEALHRFERFQLAR